MGYLIASSLTASRLDFPSEIIPVSSFLRKLSSKSNLSLKPEITMTNSPLVDISWILSCKRAKVPRWISSWSLVNSLAIATSRSSPHMFVRSLIVLASRFPLSYMIVVFSSVVISTRRSSRSLPFLGRKIFLYLNSYTFSLY